ncbi:hypothetical protein OOU_Y34scaffold00211g17 [Pyricularia oryzae Y34]|uniref:Uncharacterized protein n=1 Tax=Pyricularia oryzae (strain Y34) TaxID=1143189 RepID=A0AA97P5M1_PYRO3|nr:hypothetical protein OOU_Y34scaffold00211g17 [Pyricularia oryzae Y34]
MVLLLDLLPALLLPGSWGGGGGLSICKEKYGYPIRKKHDWSNLLNTSTDKPWTDGMTGIRHSEPVPCSPPVASAYAPKLAGKGNSPLYTVSTAQ